MVRCCNHQEFRRVLAASVNRRLFESGKKSPPPPFPPPPPPPPPRLRLGRDRPTAEATRRSCVGRQGSGLHSLRGLIFVLLSGPACSGHAGLPVPTRCKSTGESRVVAARPTRRQKDLSAPGNNTWCHLETTRRGGGAEGWRERSLCGRTGRPVIAGSWAASGCALFGGVGGGLARLAACA